MTEIISSGEKGITGVQFVVSLDTLILEKPLCSIRLEKQTSNRARQEESLSKLVPLSSLIKN
jgi:hypothetical protein